MKTKGGTCFVLVLLCCASMRNMCMEQVELIAQAQKYTEQKQMLGKTQEKRLVTGTSYETYQEIARIAREKKAGIYNVIAAPFVQDIVDSASREFDAIRNAHFCWHRHGESPLIQQGFSIDIRADAGMSYVQKIKIPLADIDKKQFFFFGDIHADFLPLFACLEHLNSDGILQGFTLRDPDNYLVFLGDYVDRGAFSVEVLLTIAFLKLFNPGNVIVLRGNHEFAGIAESSTGLNNKLHALYGGGAASLLYQSLMHWFDTFPVALFLTWGEQESRQTVLCCHGGPDALYDVSSFLNDEHASYDLCCLQMCSNRYTSFFCWIDFDLDASQLNPQKQCQEDEKQPKGKTDDEILPIRSSERGCGWQCSAGWVDGFCKKNKINGIFRGHQHDQDIVALMCDQGEVGHTGVVKLWGNIDAHDSSEAVWNGIVCTVGAIPVCTDLDFMPIAIFRPHMVFAQSELFVKQIAIEKKCNKTTCFKRLVDSINDCAKVVPAEV